MKHCILMGNPHKNENTSKLSQPFVKKSQPQNVPHELTWFYGRRTESCTACRRCQRGRAVLGCHYSDDTQEIFYQMLDSNIIILATLVYSQFCTPPIKAPLDRMVYGVNKYHGDEEDPSPWKDKQLAIIMTYGYRLEKGTNLFEEGIKCYCEHLQLNCLGVLAERGLGYQSVFLSEDKTEHFRSFTRHLIVGADSPTGQFLFS